jgi:hypothetical protein
MKTKQCKKCYRVLNISLFPVRKDSADGYRNECKECKKKYMNSFYKENREDQIKKRSNYKAKRRSLDHKWRFWKNFEDRIGEFRRKRGYVIDLTTQEMIGLSREDFYKYIESKFTEKMSWKNYGTYWCADHNVSLFYSENEEQFVKLNYFTNIKPLTINENNKKGIKIYD